MHDFRPRHRRTFVRKRAIAIILALASLSAPFALADADNFTGLVAAEMRFASDAQRLGIAAAFIAHGAEDAVLIRGEPRPAAPILARERDTPGDVLQWKPSHAVIARSGDLGMTMGPYNYRSGGKLSSAYYVTVWQLDRRGRWRWYLDHGLPGAPTATPVPMPDQVIRWRSSVGSRQRDPQAKLQSTEDALNVALAREGERSVKAYLAPDARVLRAGHLPADAGHVEDVVASDSPVRRAERRGMRMSRAGDLAATYGRIERNGPAAFYVRIWRRDLSGWRLILDEVT